MKKATIQENVTIEIENTKINLQCLIIIRELRQDFLRCKK